MQKFKKYLFPLVAIAFVTALTITAPARAGSDEVTAAVQLLNAKWDKALNSGDAAAVAALYAEDGRVVTGDGTIKNGRAEIQELFQGFIDSGFHDHKIDMIDVKISGDIAFETAKWSGVGGDKIIYGGHLVNIYERQEGGGLECRLHIWN